MTSLLRFILFGLLATVAGLRAADLPVVRTSDIASLLPNGKEPVVITHRPASQVRPSASVTADVANWRSEEGKELARIAALAPIDFAANGNDLRTVLRTICEDAGMPVFIQGDDPIMDTPVFMDGVRRPWEFLQALAMMYGLEIKYTYSFWHIYAKNFNEVVAKSYQLNHNTLEVFKAGGGSGSQGGGQMESQGQNAGSSSGGGSGGGGSAASIDRAGQGVFAVNSEALIAEVNKFLGLHTGHSAKIAGEDGLFPEVGARVSRKDGDAPQAAVSYLSDSNTLYVIATRAQHELVAEWVRLLDRPLEQLKLETKFLLTSVNPRSKSGISNPLFGEEGVGVSLSELNKEIDFNHPSSWLLDKAILSADDLSFRLNLLRASSNTTTVQYPSMTTLAGREVVLRSVRQIPIVSSQQRDTSGSALSTSSQLQFIDVGTVISILPKVFQGKIVLLNIAITVSSVVDTVVVDGNPTPVITNQTYTTQVQVEDGLTLALGGLEQTLSTATDKKLPILGDLPFFGFPFKDVTRDNSRSVLTMLITPTLLPGYSGGNTSGLAEHTLPSRGTSARPLFDGKAESTIEDVMTSLRGFSTEVEELAQINREGRGDQRQRMRVQLLLNELDLMETTLKRERALGRASTVVESEISSYRRALKGTLSTMPKIEPLG